MKLVQANVNHAGFRKDFTGLLRKYADGLSAIETLAISANLVGQLMALQDQFKYTPEQLTNLVVKNIELGNKEAIDNFLNAKGGNA